MFSTDASGLVDVFAQVFAQMSAPTVDAAGKDSKVDQTSPLIDNSKSSETKDDDRELENDVVSEDVNEPPDSAREAYLQSLANVNQPVQVQAEDSIVVDKEVSQTAVGLDDATATKPESATKAVDNDALSADLGLGDAANSSMDLGDDSRKSNRGAAIVSSTEAATIEEPDVTSSAQSTESNKLEVTDTLADPEQLDPELASQANLSDDRDSRRSSRRKHEDRDPLRGMEQAKVEAMAEKPVVTPEATSPRVETPAPTTTLEPQYSEHVSSPEMDATSKTTAVPASAAAGVTAVHSATPARTNGSSGASSNDATAPISAAGPATNARSNGTEKTNAAKGNSADDAVTRAKLVQRVSRAFQHFGAEGGSIRLRLAPAELGSVRVEMQIQGGKVNARVVAETEAASTILRDHLADLRNRLESQGMQVESFEIETDENSFSSSQDAYGQNARDAYQERSQDDRFVSEPRVAKLAVSRDVSYSVDLHDPVLLTAGVDAKF